MKLKHEPLILDNPLIFIYQLAHLLEAGNEGYRQLYRVWLHIHKNDVGYKDDYLDWLLGSGRWSKDDPSSL